MEEEILTKFVTGKTDIKKRKEEEGNLVKLVDNVLAILRPALSEKDFLEMQKSRPRFDFSNNGFMFINDTPKRPLKIDSFSCFTPR